MSGRRYYVYLLTSNSRRVLYTGVTRSLSNRLTEHRAGKSAFTAKYKAFRLVYYEQFEWIQNAKILRVAQDDRDFARLDHLLWLVGSSVFATKRLGAEAGYYNALVVAWPAIRGREFTLTAKP